MTRLLFGCVLAAVVLSIPAVVPVEWYGPGPHAAFISGALTAIVADHIWLSLDGD